MKYILVTTAMLCSVGCGWVSPDAGHEAVLVKKPFIFGHGGVDAAPVSTGLSFTAITTQSVDVDMQPQQHPVHFDDLMSSDGVPLDFDAVIRLQVTDSVKLVEKFGPNWYANNGNYIHEYSRHSVC